MRAMSLGILCSLTLFTSVPAQAKDDDWSGIYLGVEGGGASGRLTASGNDTQTQLSNIFVAGRGIVIVPGTTVTYADRKSNTHFVYGGLIGGQWQNGSLIFGVEGDIHGPRDFTGFTTSSATPPTTLATAGTATVSRSAHMSYDWSLRARIGTPVGEKAMVYLSGGVAGTRVRLDGVDTFTAPAGAAATGSGIAAFNVPAIGPVILTASERRSFTGWTAGAGGEIKIAANFGIGIDGRYTNYGAHDFALASGCAGSTAVAGTCAGTSRTAPPIVISGTTLNPATDVTPAVVPGATRVSLSDVRVTVRAVLHF